MNTNRNKIGTGIATFLAGTVAIFPTLAADADHGSSADHNKRSKPSVLVGAANPKRWEPCPAVDTEPACEIVHLSSESSSHGSQVARDPDAADDSVVSIGDAKDRPGYEAVDSAYRTTDWVDDIGIGCRRVPWPRIVICPE
jgi:hypothetical protein